MKRVVALCAASACAALALLTCGCGGSGVERVEWPVMGTVAALQTRCGASVADGSELSSVRSVFSEIERLLNAHDPESALRRMAGLPDDELLRVCDAGRGGNGLPALATRPCYEAALALMKASGGAFNPRWRGPGTLDLGAIAKGFALDAAEELVHVTGRRDMLLDLGGNLKALRCEGGSGRTWRVGVKDPEGGGFAATVDLREGEALATSATYYRGSHIYDGRTGRPAANGVASVTVLCRSAMWADGLSTALFVMGPDEGRAFLERCGADLFGDMELAVLWLLEDGRTICADPSARFRNVSRKFNFLPDSIANRPGK